MIIDRDSKILLESDYCYFADPSIQGMGKFIAVAIVVLLCAFLSEVSSLLNGDIRNLNELLSWAFVLSFFMFMYYLLPSSWGVTRYFFVNYRGIYFPKTLSQRNKTVWLLIPWSRVKQIEVKAITKDYGGGEGDQVINVLSIKTLLTTDEKRWIGQSESGFESGIEWALFLFVDGSDIYKENPNAKVMYDHGKDSPHDAAIILNELKTKYA